METGGADLLRQGLDELNKLIDKAANDGGVLFIDEVRFKASFILLPPTFVVASFTCRTVNTRRCFRGGHPPPLPPAEPIAATTELTAASTAESVTSSATNA